MKKAPLFKDMVLPSGAFLSFSRPLVMAVVNCTPDSFYPQSRAASPEEAADRALRAQEEGAGIIDFGAESSRPGSDPVDEDEEIRRLIPALRRFRQQSALPVSVDTRKPAAARAALDEGADIINDISALSNPGMVSLCAEWKAGAVLMHMRGDPRTMQVRLAGTSRGPALAREIREFLLAAVDRAAEGGVARDRIILDPGIGFGKTTEDNIAVLNRLATIAGGDYPLLVGLSRKNFIGEITCRGPEGRLAGTAAAHVFALLAGADIIRVHDTAEAVDLVKVIQALRRDGDGE